MKKLLYIIPLFLCGSLSAQIVKDTTLQGGTLDESSVFSERKYVTSTSIAIKPILFKLTPSLFGETDPLKVILLTPGINNQSEGDVGIYIRGGNFDQSMITLDDVPLYNPSHLKGFVSAFNSDIIGSTLIYKGAFPAKFGTRLSGVVDIKTRDGDFKNYHGGISVGMLSSKAYFEAPLIKDKTSLIISGRKSYFNLLLAPIFKKITNSNEGIIEQFSKTGFYDVTAKVSHKQSNKDFFSLNFYLGNDKMRIGQSDASSIQEEDTYIENNNSKGHSDDKWGNLASNLLWKHLFTPKLSLSSYLSFGRYKQAFQRYAYNEYEKRDKYSNTLVTHNIERSSMIKRSGIYDISIGGDLFYKKNKNHSIEMGSKYSYQLLTPTVISEKTSEYTDTTINIKRATGEEIPLHTLYIYAGDEMRITKWFSAGVGFRLNIYSVTNKTYFVPEPRVRSSVFMTDNFSIKASYSRMSQAIHLLSSSGTVAPSDLWVCITDKFAPMTSNMGTLGFFYTPMIGKHPILFSLEGYYKTMNNLLEYLESRSSLSSTDWKEMVDVGRGWSYGVEFFVQKQTGKTTGNLSYTWSKSMRNFENINSGRDFYALNDCRHNLSLSISQSIGKHLDLSATFVYHTGKRGTLSNIIVKSGDLSILKDKRHQTAVLDQYHFIATYRERNSFMFDDYHRLDLSINYHINHKKGRSDINLSVYNAYNHLNPYMIYVTKAFSRYYLTKLCIMPILPSITYSYSF